VKILAAVLIVTAIWLVLASVREGRGRVGEAVDRGDVWMIEQHDPVVRLGCQAALPAEVDRLRALRDRLEAHLAEAVPGLALNGHPIERLPNTLNVSFPGVDGAELLAATPSVAASTGSACHEGHTDPSPVLVAMGLARDRALGAVRLTLGRWSTEDEVDAAATALVATWRAMAALPSRT